MDPIHSPEPTETSTTGDGKDRASRGVPANLDLLIVWHPDPRFEGLRCPIWAGARLVLGRGSPAFGRGPLDNPRLSRRHVELQLLVGPETAVVELRDLGSTNGTWYRGQRVEAVRVGERAAFVAGDIVFLIVPANPSVVVSAAPRAAPRLISRSASMSVLLDQLALVAPRTTPVLLLGESGSGKEVMARRIHEESGRGGAFVATNCGGLAEGVLHSELFGHVRGAFSGADRTRAGLVERARGGTLFLDEIGDASPALQVTLLRLLQEREFRAVGSDETQRAEIRCVAATNVDLAAAIAEGRFRHDLYTRLSRWVLRIPPLRERPEDIPLLAEAFAVSYRGPGARLSRPFVETLLAYEWPGNVRELDAAIERACVASPEDGPLSPPEWMTVDLTPRTEIPATGATASLTSAPRRRPDRDTLLTMLEQHGGEVKALATALGVSRSTLYRWFEALGITSEGLRGR